RRWGRNCGWEPGSAGRHKAGPTTAGSITPAWPGAVPCGAGFIPADGGGNSAAGRNKFAGGHWPRRRGGVAVRCQASCKKRSGLVVAHVGEIDRPPEGLGEDVAVAGQEDAHFVALLL